MINRVTGSIFIHYPNRTMSKEVCFVYLNFVGKVRSCDMTRAVANYKKGIVDSLRFSMDNYMIDIIYDSGNCLRFLDKYYVKS